MVHEIIHELHYQYSRVRVQRLHSSLQLSMMPKWYSIATWDSNAHRSWGAFPSEDTIMILLLHLPSRESARYSRTSWDLSVCSRSGSDSLLDHPHIVVPIMLSFIFFALISIVCFIRMTVSLAVSTLVQSDQLQQKLKQLASKKAVIVLDGDNIRGKSRFKLSKEGLTVPWLFFFDASCPAVLLCR